MSDRLYRIILSFFVVCGLTAGVFGDVDLLKDGESQHVIVLNADASESEKFAADEFQRFFEKCTGVKLPIITGGDEKNRPMIVMGTGCVAESLGVGPDKKQLGEEGCLIKTVGKNIVFAGTPQGGTLYGVHRFLEDQLGVRWFAPDETKTPEIKNLTVPAMARLIKPAFEYRDVSYWIPDAEFKSRLGNNAGGTCQGTDKLGRIQTFLGTCHSYFWYVSPAEFFDSHPEYFSEIGGVRQKSQTQLCLTNPDVLEIATQRMLAKMKANPHIREFNFSQMDHYNYCECEKCKAMNKKYGTHGGTQFWFVNELAKRTSAVYPDKKIGTLAYMFTEEPPKGMKMHPNVVVHLCHMFPCCDTHPINDCPDNAEYKRRVLEWNKICDNVYVWHYIVDFSHYFNPFPNFRAMDSDLKFYRDAGVKGAFLQGMGHGGGGGEFSRLRNYLAYKLLQNPDLDSEAVIREFLQGYYGPAWQPIWKYIKMMHDRVEKKNIHMHLYSNPACGHIPDKVLARANALFNQAERLVADDPVKLQRVQVARLPLEYAAIFPRNGYEIKNGELVFPGVSSVAKAAMFVAKMKKYGFKNIREIGGNPAGILAVAAMMQSGLKLETIRNEFLQVDVVPVLAGRALRIIDRKSGKCVTACNKKECLYFPFCGGLETRLGTMLENGWMEPATIAAKSENSITTVQQLPQGKLTRTLTLQPGQPVMDVKTVLTNTTNRDEQCQLRSHLELDPGELESAEVSFTDRAGRAVKPTMKSVIAGLREGLTFDKRSLPAGRWTFRGTKGLELIHKFDENHVLAAKVYSYPARLGELETQLATPYKLLKPGESMQLDQSLEIRNLND